MTSLEVSLRHLPAMKSQREIFLNLHYNVKIIFTLPIVMLVYFKQSQERPVLQTTCIGKS